MSLPTCRVHTGPRSGRFLAGEAPLGAVAPVPETRFVEATGKSFNTVYPNDFGFWELVQRAGAAGAAGARAIRRCSACWPRVGIVHGEPFEPDARMRKILEEAVVVGNATARTVTFAARPEEGFAFYPDSAWESALFVGGYEFLDPPPQITADGVVAAPSDGARKLNSRTNFFYMATGITPAMCMRLTGIGSQYIYAMRDSQGEYFDGARDYRLTLPPDIPESRFWSLIVYDRQTRSMLQTDQPLPRLGSQSGTVETNPDGSTDIYFGPDSPERKGVQLAPDRFPARAGGRFFGSTTRSSRSSTRPGGRPRSSPWTRRSDASTSTASAGSRPSPPGGRLPAVLLKGRSPGTSGACVVSSSPAAMCDGTPRAIVERQERSLMAYPDSAVVAAARAMSA